MFLLFIALTAALPNIELACIGLDASACEAIADKLRLYNAGYAVSIVPAQAADASPDTVFRATLLAEGERCTLEVLDLSDPARAPALTALDCRGERAPFERRAALHIKGEIESRFADALAALQTQPRRARTIKSTLAPAQPPASAPAASAPAASAPAAPRSLTPRADTPAARWRFGLAAMGGGAGLGAIAAASAGLGLHLDAPPGAGGELGFRGDFRPPLATRLGPLSSTFLSPYLRLHWRLGAPERLSADIGAQAEVLIALLQLGRAPGTFFVTGGAGPAVRLRMPFFSGRLTLFVEARALACFNRVNLRAAGTPLFSLAPILWGGGGGIEVFF